MRIETLLEMRESHITYMDVQIWKSLTKAASSSTAKYVCEAWILKSSKSRNVLKKFPRLEKRCRSNYLLNMQIKKKLKKYFHFLAFS